jgi:hypothetical protein
MQATSTAVVVETIPAVRPVRSMVRESAFSTTVPRLSNIMLTPCVASSMLLVPAWIIAAVAGPTTDDLYAVLGVAPATVVVMYYAANKGRTAGHFASVLCGSGAVGIFLPGVLAHTVLRNWLPVFTWHAWMGLGFICALAGWALTYASLRVVFGRSEWFMGKWADRLFPESKPPEPPATK